jgi:hypothetical protein
MSAKCVSAHVKQLLVSFWSFITGAIFEHQH